MAEGKKRAEQKTLIVGLYVDEEGTMMQTREEEYEEIENHLKELVPEAKFRFIRNLEFHKAKDTRLHAYCFDFGGLCGVDFSGGRRQMMVHNIARCIEDKPGTLFLPWSSMTTRDYWYFIQEDYPELVAAGNVVFRYNTASMFDYDADKKAAEIADQKTKSWLEASM